MKKLSKEQQALRADLTGRLQKALNEVNTAIVDYNEVVADIESWRDEVRGEAQDWHDGRSEKWQKSDAGAAHQEWIDAYDSLDTQTVEEIGEDLLDALNETALEPQEV